MTHSMEPIKAPRTGRPRENLAVLASSAAINLDRMARGTSASLEPLKQLAAALRDALNSKVEIPNVADNNIGPSGQNGVLSESESHGHTALLDPVAADLLSRALPGNLGGPGGSLPELSSKTQEFIEQLESVSESESKVILEELRDLCIAVSRSAQAQYAIAQFGGPEHPYQR